MVKCEKCGATVPNESKFCLNCGNRIDSSSPKHFSLDEIARQQQMQEDSAFSITPEVPDDDPESYLPPIGAKEHQEIPKGEIDPEYFNHKPLPNIQAADPLELLDANTPELPPIGFSDQMQIDDIKMPEGIRHYHGSHAVPRNLQMQTAVPIAANGDTYYALSQAQMQRQVIDQQAHGDKEHFSVIPENMQVKFCTSPEIEERAFSFNNFFIDEYVPEKDIPPKVKKPKKVVIRRVSEPSELPRPQPKTANEIPRNNPSQSVSLEKKQTVPEIPPNNFTPPVSLEKQQTVPEIPPNNFTPPVSLEKQQAIPEIPPNNFTPPVSLEKQQTVPEIPQEYQNFAPPQTGVTLEKTQNHIQPANDFNFSSPAPQSELPPPEPPVDNAPQQQEEFTFFSFTDPQNNTYQNSFSQPMGSPYTSPYQTNPSYQGMSSSVGYTPTMMDKILLIAGLVLSAIELILIIAIISCTAALFMKLFSGSLSMAELMMNSVPSSAEGVTVSGFDKNSTKYSNLNNGGLATEDDSGNVYYTDAKGCICRLSPDGNTNIVYNGTRTNNYILYINYLNDRLYFLSSVTGNSLSVCSVDMEGKDLKIYTEASKPVFLLAHGKYLYYLTEDTNKIDRIDLETEKSQRFYTTSDTITNLFVYENQMYILSLNKTENGGKVHSVNLAAPSAITNMSFSYNGTPLEPMGMSLCGDRIVLINNSKYNPGVVFSSDMSGNDVRKLGGTNIVKVSGYGDYIYYLSINGDLMNAADTAVNGGSALGIFNLGMMKSDGSASYTLKNDIIYYSIAKDRIYYVGSSGGMFSMSTNGSDSKSVS